MAARLPLILSQPSKRDATAVDMIENIVAAALMLPKLDANLIGDISSIELGSTDHLCLQGHTRDVILASFLELASAEAAWGRLGQSGRFVDCQQNLETIRAIASNTTERRVFYFQLSHQLRVPRLLDQCQELVASQAVQLVSIQLGAGNQSVVGKLPIVSRSSTSDSTADTNRARPSPAGPQSRATSRGSTSKATTPYTLPLPVTTDDDEDWSSLDKLVDDLDAMDL